MVSHLGINRASLYDTFGGKEELFNKAFAQYRSGSRNWLKSLFENANGVKAGFRKLFGEAIKESVEDPYRKGCFVVNTTTELIPGDATLLEILGENKSQLIALFSEYIQKGIKDAELSSTLDVEGTASMLFTFYNGLRVVAKVDPNPVKLQKMVDTALSVLD